MVFSGTEEDVPGNLDKADATATVARIIPNSEKFRRTFSKWEEKSFNDTKVKSGNVEPKGEEDLWKIRNGFPKWTTWSDDTKNLDVDLKNVEFKSEGSEKNRGSIEEWGNRFHGTKNLHIKSENVEFDSEGSEKFRRVFPKWENRFYYKKTKRLRQKE